MTVMVEHFKAEHLTKVKTLRFLTNHQNFIGLFIKKVY